MKYIFKSFLFLCCSLSFCFAGVKETFRQEFEANVIKLKSLHEQISHLKEADYETYFGRSVKRPNQAEKAKHLLFCSQRGARYYFEESASWNLVASGFSEEEMLSQLSFKLYCIHVPLLQNLYDEVARVAHIEPTAAYLNDLEQCIKAVNIFPTYFSDQIEATFALFLKVKPNGKDGLLTNYSVHLNENDWFLIQRRQIRNILNRLNLLDVEKLSLPQAYKESLQGEIV